MIGLLQMLKKRGFGGEIYDFAVDYTSTNIGVYITFIDI